MYAEFADPFYLIRLEREEEIIDSLASWALNVSLPGAMISGLGALRAVTLGFYDESRREYVKKEHPGPLEILSLSGGISTLGGKPYVHLHTAVADADGKAWGGHLFRGTITATGEIYVFPCRTTLRRVPDSREPFHLLDLPTFPRRDHA